jgi:hypothetical protein
MNLGMTALRGVTYRNPLKADDGYSLLCPKYSKDMWLIDIEGHIVNRWRMPYLPAGHGILLPNGNLLYGGQLKSHQEVGLPKEFSALGGILMEVDWDGEVVWQAEIPYQHHDFQVLGNGNIVCATHDSRGILPADYAAELKGGIPGTELEGKILGDTVVEIDRQGKVVWEWIAYKHLDPKIDRLCPLETRAKWPLVNSIWVCHDGDLLLSLRLSNEVVKINYPTGKVVARYGRGEIYHQHDARELENGNILVFDNGNHRPCYGPSYSRVVEINPSVDPASSDPWAAGTIVWEYKSHPPSDFYSAVAAGNERLTNGNTFICDAQSGRVFEVSPEGEIVWEYVSSFRNNGTGNYSTMLWRAHRYERDFPGLKGRDLDPDRYLWENRMYGPQYYGASNVGSCLCNPHLEALQISTPLYGHSDSGARK